MLKIYSIVESGNWISAVRKIIESKRSLKGRNEFADYSITERVNKDIFSLPSLCSV